MCGLFKVVRNRKRLHVDRWETFQRLDSGDLAPSRSEARVCLIPTPSVCPSSRISIGRLYKLRNSLHNHDVALMRRHAGRWSGMRAETQKEAQDLRLSGSSFESAMARTRTRSFNGGSGPGRRLFIFVQVASVRCWSWALAEAQTQGQPEDDGGLGFVRRLGKSALKDSGKKKKFSVAL